MNRDNKPIKFNPSGKYNMNFIDLNNEWERVSEIENKIENDEPVSDEEEYHRVKAFLDKEKQKNGVNLLPQKTIISQQELKTMVKSKKPTECYICFKNFKIKDIVMKLPCEHIFCSGCLMPWLKLHHVCPTCKFNLKGDNNDNNSNDDAEDIDLDDDYIEY